MGTFSRTILRKAARTKMEKAGITQINKKRHDSEGRVYSTFSENWREFAPHKAEDKDKE
jgi:hypothetical protein